MSSDPWSDAQAFLQWGELLADDVQFTTAALSLFERQIETNPPYAAFCRRLGRTPAGIRHWTEIPAVPTDAYKQEPLATFDPAEAERVFMTSGTTSGPEKRGKIYKDRKAMAIHDAVVRDGFRRWCLPDRDRIRLLVLAPPAPTVPHLRMAHDCSLFLREFDAGGGRHFIGEGGMDVDGLTEALDQAVESGEPVMLVGATFSFARLFDACRERFLRFCLPPGSRMADGGGYKGRSRELTKAAFLAEAGERLGLSEDHCVNLLGITELTTLFFDNVLAASISGEETGRYKTNAPWTRTRAVHPETLALLPPGEAGLLRHWDLANSGSVQALQTDDLGLQVGGGFEIFGRAQGAELRGCSLAMEQFLDAAR
jgi:hypothetical protein